MCQKCEELDNKIERYERIRASIGDQLTVDQQFTPVLIDLVFKPGIASYTGALLTFQDHRSAVQHDQPCSD
jgi:hypothetical protein